MTDFDANASTSTLKTNLIIFGIPSVLVAAFYFAVCGTLVIENNSGQTIDRLKVWIDKNTVLKERPLEPGESVRVSISAFKPTNVAVSAKLDRGGSSFCTFEPTFFPSHSIQIDEKGGYEGLRGTNYTVTLSWPRPR